MGILWKDLKYGARSLVRRPGFTALAVMILALGIGANTVIFSVVSAVILRPLPYPSADRLMVAWEQNKDGGASNTSFTTVHDWRERSRTLDIAAFRAWSGILTGQGDPERITGLRVSQNYFEVLGARMLIGRSFEPDEDGPQTWRVVVLGHALWQRRFGGDPGIVGRMIRLSNNEFKVVGVLPPDFAPLVSSHFYQDGAEIWAPLGYTLTDSFACRTCRHIRAVARVRPGSSIEQASTEMTGIASELYGENPGDYERAGVLLVPLHQELTGNVQSALLLLAAAVALVLLIGCANVANLMLARAAERQREVGIRLALGASRMRIVRQMLTESLLLASAGGIIGLLLTAWGIQALPAFSPAELTALEGARVDGSVLSFTLVVSILTAVLFGTAPAMLARKTDPVTSIKEGAGVSGGPGQRRLSSLLVVGNVAVALVLLVGAGLLLESFRRVLHVDPGFDPRQVLTAQLSALGPTYREEPALISYYSEVVRRVAALPGVEAVGAATQLPLSGNYDRSGLMIDGRPHENPALGPSAERYGIVGDYLRAMRVPLLRGREFVDADTAESERVVLINEAMARAFWPNEDPIGQRIRLGGDPSPMLRIVGIVGDVRHYRLEEPPTYQAYVPHAQWAGSYMRLVVRAPAQVGLADAIRREVWAVDRDLPVHGIQSAEAIVSSTVVDRRFTMLLLAAFAALAVLLAAGGLYGVMAYSVTRRARELSIRLALGARPADVFRLVVGRGLALVLAGAAIGLAGAFVGTRWLAAMLYEVSPTDPGTLTIVLLLLLIVALAACWIPARRASRVDPMTVLRHE